MTPRDDHRHPPGFRPSPPEEASTTEDPTVLEGDADRRVVLEAAPEDVWRALTDPSELDAWWGEGERFLTHLARVLSFACDTYLSPVIEEQYRGDHVAVRVARQGRAAAPFMAIWPDPRAPAIT